jgi:DNA-directed RNA polymerase-3 subunit RPC5
MDVDENDEVVSVLPIHYSDTLSPDIHIHQFPLLNRPLQVPPIASASGKFIRARLKSNSRRLEIHVPVDTRPEVRNLERSKQQGAARLEDDRDKNQDSKDKMTEGEEPRLSEVRLKSEEIPQKAVYVLGFVKDGDLYFGGILCDHIYLAFQGNYICIQ